MFSKKGPAMLAISLESAAEFHDVLKMLETAATRICEGRLDYPFTLLLKDPSVPAATWEAFHAEVEKEFEMERSRLKHGGRQN